MPLNLAVANPSDVLPQMTYTAYLESRVYPMLVGNQHDGTTIRSLIEDGTNPPSSVKSWTLSVRLPADALATLKTFYEAHVGTAFYFYDPFSPATDTPIASNYDGTGDSTQGRYTVRFTNDSWIETFSVGRTDSSFQLTEIA